MRANSLNFSLYWRFHFFIYCLHRFWLPAVIPLSSQTVTRERFTAVSAVHTFLVSSFNPIGVIFLFTSTLSRPEPLRWVKFYPCTVAPCTLRHRFGVSSVSYTHLTLPTSYSVSIS